MKTKQNFSWTLIQLFLYLIVGLCSWVLYNLMVLIGIELGTQLYTYIVMGMVALLFLTVMSVQ